jgi:arginine-tRNA-protein transferase
MTRLTVTPFQQFYRTGAQPCPYIDGRAERKIITELAGPGGVSLYNELSRAGFRRSHTLAYRPACGQCTACLPVRIDANEHQPGRSAKRLLQHNRDLVVTTIKPSATAEQYRLFVRYQHARHEGGDMAAMSFGDYRAMVEDSPLDTVLVTARDGEGRLMAVCLTDDLDDGCSAVYSFYEPDAPRRSLGTWLVLQLIERMRRRRLAYVYLGYWIEGSPKMNYKVRFRPLEALGPRGWEPVVAEAD